KIWLETDSDRLPSADLVTRLTGLKDRRWCEWKNSKPMTERQLARLLAPYGITPGTIRIAEKTIKGYLRTAFADAFGRYLPSGPPSDPSHRHNPQNSADFQRSPSVTSALGVTDRKCPKPKETATCDGVTDEMEGAGAEIGQWVE